jgi:hypothetical protein
MPSHWTVLPQGVYLGELRNELPTMKTLEWIKVRREMTPLKVIVHHTPAQLLDLHETLAGEHRGTSRR